MSKIIFLYNPRLSDAEPFARDLVEKLSSLDLKMEIASVWEESAVREMASNADFAVTLGGDGTVLRAARILVPLGIPIVGVNLGKLGFLTELSRQEAARKIPQFLRGRCWTEERVVLSVEVHRRAKPAVGDWVAPGEPRIESFLAINEVVVGRAALARAVDVSIWVDGILVTKYVGDGAIVSTPTGSTAYSLAAGGPILHPQLGNLLLTPILPHLGDAYPLVCPPESDIQLEVITGHQAEITIDGQIDAPLYNGDLVRAFAALQKARFLRIQSPSYFYSYLHSRLRKDARKDRRDAGIGAVRVGVANVTSKGD